MNRIEPEIEINRYLSKGIKLNKEFMMGDKNEEIRYVIHNKPRYIEALLEIDKLVDSKKSKINIMDIGTSPLTFILKSRYPHANIFTIDYSNKFKDDCVRHGVVFKKVDLQNRRLKFYKNKFDVVVFLEVLEHLSGDHKKVISNVFKSLKSKGVCILQTPNKNCLKNLLISLTNNFWMNESKAPEKGPEFEHQKEYSFFELVKLVSSIKKSEIILSKYSLYFDKPQSALVYRKKGSPTAILIWLNYFIVLILPFFRRGLCVVFRHQ